MQADDVIDRLRKVAHHDWKHSHPLDLSDEGLLADLETRLEGLGKQQEGKRARRETSGV